MLNNPRKLASFISLAATIGNLFAIIYLVKIASFSEFVSILPTSPHFMIITAAGLISLAITSLLFSPVNLNKKARGAMLGISVVILVAAVIQTSMTILFILFWPWSLYKFYKTETV